MFLRNAVFPHPRAPPPAESILTGCRPMQVQLVPTMASVEMEDGSKVCNLVLQQEATYADLRRELIVLQKKGEFPACLPVDEPGEWTFLRPHSNASKALAGQVVSVDFQAESETPIERPDGTNMPVKVMLRKKEKLGKGGDLVGFDELRQMKAYSAPCTLISMPQRVPIQYLALTNSCALELHMMFTCSGAERRHQCKIWRSHCAVRHWNQRFRHF